MLTSTRKDLKEAYRQREELERKIAKLRQMVTTLGAMCEEDGLQDFKEYVPRSGKLTDAVNTTVVASAVPLTAIEIRGVLEDLGYRFQSSNPLGSIHSVLTRLEQQGLVARVCRAKPDGTVDKREEKFWYGGFPPPAPWVFSRDVTYDKDRRAHVVKKGKETGG